MTNTTAKPQNTIEPGKNSSGLGSSGRLGAGGSGNDLRSDDRGRSEHKEDSEEGKNGGVPENAPTHQKRRRFDKDGHPLISKGFLIRADIDKKYDIKSAVLHVNKYELVNDALLFYYENVLKKTTSQKLLEAGQEELELEI
jgi:hypothetical protein